MRGRSWVVGKGLCAGRWLWRIAPHWILPSLSINLPNRVCGWGMKEVDSDSRRIRWASRGRMSERVMKTQLSISIWKAQRRRHNTRQKYKSQMPTLPSILSSRCRQSSWHLENIGLQFLDCLFKCGPRWHFIPCEEIPGAAAEFIHWPYLLLTHFPCCHSPASGTSASISAVQILAFLYQTIIKPVETQVSEPSHDGSYVKFRNRACLQYPRMSGCWWMCWLKTIFNWMTSAAADVSILHFNFWIS